MIPVKFIEIAHVTGSRLPYDNAKFYFDNQYPDVSDCVKLKNQIEFIKKDIADILIRISNHYNENLEASTVTIGGVGVTLRTEYFKYATAQLQLKETKFNTLKCPVTTSNIQISNNSVPITSSSQSPIFSTPIVNINSGSGSSSSKNNGISHKEYKYKNYIWVVIVSSIVLKYAFTELK